MFLRFPPGVDCMVFDDEDCEVDDWDAPLNYTGRRVSRQNGNLGLLSEKSFSLTKGLGNFKYKNTIESVAVRRGCQLEVFDDSGNPFHFGQSKTFSNLMPCLSAQTCLLFLHNQIVALTK